ncbi:MAG TPA: 16S rRNA (cytosine(1402)-N(4))-methyltransferase RsmH [candidate division Zixibacteria bacterium]|nr:16S rRNA (cytosine(1402)-N(4))-methyltransferase RsmH [candidate division Zixibacteria bacterium]
MARFLITRGDGCYLDLTCGGGGHLKYLSGILSREAMLIGIDRDPEAIAAAREKLGRPQQNLKFINSTFGRLSEVMEELGIKQVDGILFDLGVSSHQIDSPRRGFSFMHDGPLDMRMGDDVLNAETVVNTYSEKELALIFRKYGEERAASRAARVICRARQEKRIDSTERLREVLSPVLPPGSRNASLARLFQAIRIEVNRELEQLEKVLPLSLEYLAIGGRLVVISYHSLEDRMVKRFLAEKAKGCVCPKEFPVCVCGRKPEVKVLTKKVVKPSDEEIKNNSRARSARMRAAEKIA